ncbi:hypothetical protein VTO58DRAFT_108309 [Aureobasidium pullulans]|nr:hypothetical protein D6C80_06441 [Aureobasidium pullulans]
MPGGGPSIDVHGIGTVVLPTRTYDEGKSHKPSSEITLHHVLYAPSGITNIFAWRQEQDLDVTMSFGKSAGPIKKRGSNKYYVHATWPNEEIEKYNKFIGEPQARKQNELPSNAVRDAKATSSAPLTTEESAFLKKNYGGEFKFLMSFGLKMHNEDDREEGRRILRAFMSEEDDEPMADSDDAEDSDESNDFLAELEEDPTSHLADYKFSPDQLDFIKKNYRHSGNFMLCHGLKPFDNDDCDEAVSTVRALMED